MSTPQAQSVRRGGFTLVELLITITIIGMIASMMLFAMYSAQETARAQKTRALIAKLDSIIKNKWESYRTRRVPFNYVPETYTDVNGNGKFDFGTDTMINDWNGNGRWDDIVLLESQYRITSLRDLMRMELPERWSDIAQLSTMRDPVSKQYEVASPVTPARPLDSAMAPPSVWNNYVRKLQAKIPTRENESAECLYLIVMSIVQEDGDDKGLFKPDNIGDTDTTNGPDGYPEFIDGWGKPIRFLRWAPGFFSELNVLAYGKITDFTAATGPPSPAPASLQALNDPAIADGTLNSLFSKQSGAYQNCSIFITSNDAFYNCSAAVSNFTPNLSGTGAVTFTFNTAPFNGMSPPVGDTFVILAADPFDPGALNAYPPTPLYPASSGNLCSGGMTCAMYPLIYSAGPDKTEGIVTGFDIPATDPSRALSYRDTNLGLNAFPVAVARNGDMVGSRRADDSGVTDAWKDNIHNHAQGLK